MQVEGSDAEWDSEASQNEKLLDEGFSTPNLRPGLFVFSI